MNGNFVRFTKNLQSFNNNNNGQQQRQPSSNNFFDFRSIYDDTDDFFEAARNFPTSGRQSVPVGFRAGELSNKFGGGPSNEINDTSSGYSTASSAAPSSSTYWTRKSDNDSEFVPIKEEEELSLNEDSDTNTFGGSATRPAWRQNKSKFFDPPSIHDLLNTYDQFDPEPLLQRAVAASERVNQYVNDTPRLKRPQTALADPFPYNSRAQPNPRRSSTSNSIATLDLNDFPSTNRGDPHSLRQRHSEGLTPGLRTNDYNLSPRFTHRTTSLPQNDRWLSVQVPNTNTVDTSILDSVLHSPGRGSEPSHLQRQQRQSAQEDFFATPSARRHLDLKHEYYPNEPMSKTTSNWKNSFANMRERFDKNAEFSDAEEDPLFRGAYATDGSMTMPRNGQRVNGNFLTKSASQNTIDERSNERPSLLNYAVNRRANETSDHRFDNNSKDDRPRARLGDFWLETVRNRLDAPSNFQRSFSPRLTAAERLEQLHEPIDPSENREVPIQEHLVYRRPGAADNVASRRAQYLKEMFRSQSPSIIVSQSGSNRPTPTPIDYAVSSNASTTTTQVGPNFAPLDSAVAEMSRSGCGRFPTTNELKYSSTTNNPDGSKTRSYFGQTSYNAGDGTNMIVTTSRSSTQHSPSPDTLSDTSQQSLIFLPHPKPKHNLRDQLMNAGIGNSIFGGFPGRRLLTNGPFSTNLSSSTTSSSPNFPTTNNVAARISALEKQPGAPNLLQLACVLTSNNAESSAPMSPRSTVFRTKPVIHMDYDGNSANEIVKRDDGNVFFPSSTSKLRASADSKACFDLTN